MTRERLHIDWTRCRGRGACHELLPELLAADDWGYPLARHGDAHPVVPPALHEHAERAVADCPRLALRLAPVHEPTRGADVPRAARPHRPADRRP